jgi:hypothetical protein
MMSKFMSQSQALVRPFRALAASVLLALFAVNLAHAAAKPSLTIKSAAYNKKTASLVVKTSGNVGGGLLSLIHSQGGVLGQSSDSEHIFTIPQADLGEIPCQVEARVGELTVSKAVSGASAECKKVPVCKLLTPASNISIDANVSTRFEAQVTLKDKTAAPLTIEWDFAGGAMSHPFERLLKNGKPVTSGKVSTEARFVRDNSRYHVRFAAIDKLGRRCESGVYVDVGPQPTDMPPETDLIAMVTASQANPPGKGSALNIPPRGRVVMPYQDWTMQTGSDARMVPNTVLVYGPLVNNINAVVYEKARLPQVVTGDLVELKYSAASNPADPVGPNSINSTSQNWPPKTKLMGASIQKGDFFDVSDNVITSDGLVRYSLASFLNPNFPSVPDEGMHNPQANPPVNADHGLYMPGIAAPYAVNDPQPFSEYVPYDERLHFGNFFAARMLPLTDIDDKGRVNPFPLYRIEANEVGNATPIAATDIAANSGRDFHCRECHAKDQMGANARTDGVYGQPQFYDAESDSIFDQEFAAIKNMLFLHYGVERENGPAGCTDANGACHTTAYSTNALSEPFVTNLRGGPLSIRMHGEHAIFGYNADKTDVQRDASGSPEVAVSPYRDPLNYAVAPEPVFPVTDAKGEPLPMEDNCLKCHGGKREQSYRDRMYTAGVTCYQCHGDMYAVSGVYKSVPSLDGRIQRKPWIDEPDCGSCHTGNANKGKNGNAEFFSGGVRKLAFAKDDVSATPYQPDPLNPDEIRFAVPISDMTLGDTIPADGGEQAVITKAPLYRLGKDNHGAVPCAACHGPAHGIWPNHDPNANDNVTSLQLQGYKGAIAECSVCHTADSFAKLEELDEGDRVWGGKPKKWVLGGPHNMHPINDPNWWKSAAGDFLNSDGTTTGGFHNDYAKKPGKLGEDQCAACHGNDHLGTRLSKTPVDREFVTAKGKKISVKAGTAIGCNLCHTIEKSCTQSPAASDCGKPSDKVVQSRNRAPVFTSPSESVTVVGEDYKFTVAATDPDGGAVTYQLFGDVPLKDLQIDSTTGVVTGPAISTLERVESNQTNHYGVDTYYVSATDSQGATSTQVVRVFADCPTGLLWNITMCDKIMLEASSMAYGMNAGETFRYQVVAAQRSGEALNYSLSGQPSGMTIGANNGMVNWVIPEQLSGVFNFTISVSNKQGDKRDKNVALTVCAAPQQWDGTKCLGPISITSRPALGANAGDSFSYQVTVNDPNTSPITYSLSDAPDGMTIDAGTGLINWLVQPSASGSVTYTVSASDGLGAFTQQKDYLFVCAPPEYWGGKWTGCKGPIDFTSSPSINGVDVGQLYQYQAVASHSGGLKLTYSLGDYPVDPGNPYPSRPSDMSIDPETGVVSWLAQMPPPSDYFVNQVFYAVYATDSNGYTTKVPQKLIIGVCDSPTNWEENYGCRGPVRITSKPPLFAENVGMVGMNEGDVFKYQVTAVDNRPNSLPPILTFSLDNPDIPTKLTMDENTGLINWKAENLTNFGGFISFTLTASDQARVYQEPQNVVITVCSPPSKWDASSGGCI